MMTILSAKERFWGTLAHIPIVTIIWTTYVVYRWYYSTKSLMSISTAQFTNLSSLPITPLLLTLFSIPISVSIMQMKKRSVFIHNNAQEAFHFNIWLLKSYGWCFFIALVGVLFSIPICTFVATLVGLLISSLCFYQSIHGIATAMGGHIYHYWYPKLIKLQ